MSRFAIGIDLGGGVSNIPLLKAKLGDSAGVLGAAFLALHEMGLLEF